MAESPMVGARVPQDWQQQISAIAAAAGRKEAEIVRDAIAFFREMGIRGTDVEISQACQHYGFHPLSLRLLAGRILSDLQQSGDIAIACRLDVTGDLKRRQHHVLEQAYEGLPPERRLLLSQIACFRSLITYEAIQVLATGKDARELEESLQDLLRRGLLQRDRRSNRFDMHPIVRGYAYDRLGNTDRSQTHSQLRDYFAAIPTPKQFQTLQDLDSLIELFHHTIQAGLNEEAYQLFTDSGFQLSGSI